MPDTSLSLLLLLDALGAAARRFDVDVLAACDSSNTQALARAEAGAPSGTVIVAQTQTAGRGRRGRPWLSAADASLTFSLLWRFPPQVPVTGLSLAVGLAVTRALESLGVTDLGLKWPNDVLRRVDNAWRKLAGILIELAPGAASVAVIGIGINRRLPDDLSAEIRDQAAGLGRELEPHVLLAGVLRELATVLDGFGASGFAVFRDEWMRRHAYQDQAVRLSADRASALDGICRGVDAQGALLLDTAQGLSRIISGEVSLRPVAGATP